MKIEKLFPQIFASDFLDIDNEAMAGFCHWNIQNKVKNITELKIADTIYQTNFDRSDPFVQPLADIVKDRVDLFLKEFDLTEHTTEISRCWLNVNNSREIDRPHIHRECFCTAVYYVKGSGTSDGGFLELTNPVAAYPYNIPLGSIREYNYTNSESFRVLPETGKLVIFPGWVQHYVTPNFTGEERISMVFNFKINFDKSKFTKEIR